MLEQIVIAAFVGAAVGTISQMLIARFNTRLSKSEFIFARQCDAASAFISLRRALFPSPLQAPPGEDMDTLLASELFAQSQERVYAAIQEFLSEHGAMIPKKSADALTLLMSQPAELRSSLHGCQDVPDNVASEAAKMMTELSEIEDQMRNHVHRQTA